MSNQQRIISGLFWGTATCISFICVFLAFSILFGMYMYVAWYIAAFSALVIWVNHWLVIVCKKKDGQKPVEKKGYVKELGISLFLLIWLCYCVYAGVQQHIFLVHTQMPLSMLEATVLLGIPTIICLGTLAVSVIILIDLRRMDKSQSGDIPMW